MLYFITEKQIAIYVWSKSHQSQQRSSSTHQNTAKYPWNMALKHCLEDILSKPLVSQAQLVQGEDN